MYTKKDKYYEVWLLTGPDTTKDELHYLKSINNTETENAMTNELMNTMWKSAFRMYLTDKDHEYFLGVVE